MLTALFISGLFILGFGVIGVLIIIEEMNHEYDDNNRKADRLLEDTLDES